MKSSKAYIKTSGYSVGDLAQMHKAVGMRKEGRIVPSVQGPVMTQCGEYRNYA